MTRQKSATYSLQSNPSPRLVVTSTTHNLLVLAGPTYLLYSNRSVRLKASSLYKILFSARITYVLDHQSEVNSYFHYTGSSHLARANLRPMI